MGKELPANGRGESLDLGNERLPDRPDLLPRKLRLSRPGILASLERLPLPRQAVQHHLVPDLGEGFGLERLDLLPLALTERLFRGLRGVGVLDLLGFGGGVDGFALGGRSRVLGDGLLDGLGLPRLGSQIGDGAVHPLHVGLLAGDDARVLDESTDDAPHLLGVGLGVEGLERGVNRLGQCSPGDGASLDGLQEGDCRGVADLGAEDGGSGIPPPLDPPLRRLVLDVGDFGVDLFDDGFCDL